MSSDRRYLRKSPEEMVRREPSEPPRESLIRAKSSHGVDSALDTFLQTQDRAVLAEFQKDTITDALISRLITHETKSLVPFGDLLNDAIIIGLEPDMIGLHRGAIECTALLQHPEFVRPLLNLALDAPEPARSHARDTLLDYDGLLYEGCEWLRGLLASPSTSQQRRRRGMELLALFGDPQALAPLIELLGDSDRSIARAAHEALRTLTCHDLGTMRSAWQRWAEKTQVRSRIDWLIEALADRRPDLREGALTELARITGQSFNVCPGDPRKNFLIAQQHFAALRLQSPSLKGLSIAPPEPAETDSRPR